MKRVRRRLFNLAAAVSMVLCLGVIVLWVRSYVGSEELRREYDSAPGSIDESFLQDKGRVVWFRYVIGTSKPFHDGRVVWSYGRDKPTSLDHGVLGFYAASGYGFGNGDYWREIMIPHWSLALLFAAPLSVALLMRRARRMAHRGGLCPTCGYDLRATPERCPECGTAVGERPAI